MCLLKYKQVWVHVQDCSTGLKYENMHNPSEWLVFQWSLFSNQLSIVNLEGGGQQLNWECIYINDIKLFSFCLFSLEIKVKGQFLIIITDYYMASFTEMYFLLWNNDNIFGCWFFYFFTFVPGRGRSPHDDYSRSFIYYNIIIRSFFLLLFFIKTIVHLHSICSS